MVAAGVVREQGVVDTVKNNEFGFIKPVDRTEQIYFRVDDVINQDVIVTEVIIR